MCDKDVTTQTRKEKKNKETLRMSDIDHVLKVLDIDDDGKDIVKNKVGIKKMVHFRTLPNVRQSLIDKGMSEASATDVHVFQLWYNNEYLPYENRRPIQEAVTENVMLDYMILGNYEEHEMTGTKAIQQGSAPSTTTRNTMTKPNSMLKAELKNFPKLTGTPIMDKFDDWAEAFSTIAELALCGDILKTDTEFPIPSDADELAPFEEKDRFIKAALYFALKDTTAISDLEKELTGRENWHGLRAAYMGADSEGYDTATAIQKMDRLILNRRSRHTPETVVAKFIKIMKIMDRAGVGYPDKLRKPIFLSKIHDDRFAMWRTTVENDKDKTFKDIVTEFRQQAARIVKKPTSDPTPNKLNNLQKGNKIPKDEYISADKWNKLSKEEKTKILNKQAEKRNKKKDGDKLPMQYGGLSINAAMLQKLQELVAADEEQESQKKSSVNFTKTGPTKSSQYTTGNTKMRVSDQAFKANETTMSQDTNEGRLIIDSGTNTTVMGRGFKVIEFTERYADLEGFSSDLTKNHVRIGSGVATVDLGMNGKVLIGVHEAPYLGEQANSLLSTAQARENGVWIDDRLTRHGGKQMLRVEQTEIPLSIEDGLAGLEISVPTEDEMESLPTLWLTSDLEWQPGRLDGDNEYVLSEDEPGYEGAVNQLEKINEFQRKLRGQDLANHLAYTLGNVSIIQTLYHIFNGQSKKKVGVKIATRDYEKYRPKMGWLPVETVRKTFEATTQLAKIVPLRLPLRRHIKSRFPQLNRQRLRETFATDTLFSSEDAFGGISCAQLYVGLKSLFVALYGMKTESEGPDTLEDFIREFGAPYNLRNDNSKMQLGNNFREVLRKYNIKQSMTEPHHPQQNAAERKIQEVKKYTNMIMDRTGAPPKLWFLCMLYTVHLLNHTAMEALKWRTPLEAAFGETPDISSLLQFEFYEPVYYLLPDASFPDTKEQLGHFVGIAANTGDAMCYVILTETDTFLVRSVVRSAKDTKLKNQRDPLPDSSLEGRPFSATVELKTELDDKRQSQEDDEIENEKMSTISMDDLVGQNLIREFKKVPTKATVKEYDDETDRLLLEYITGAEEWVAPNIVEEAIQANDDESKHLWTYTEILGH